jgi:hypothetical protein
MAAILDLSDGNGPAPGSVTPLSSDSDKPFDLGPANMLYSTISAATGLGMMQGLANDVMNAPGLDTMMPGVASPAASLLDGPLGGGAMMSFIPKFGLGM